MSTTRLYSLLGTYSIFFRSKRSKLSPVLPIRFRELLPSQILRFRRYGYSSAATVGADNVGTEILTTGSTSHSGDVQHPWPEWITFIDRLKAKGYLVESRSSPPPAPPDDVSGASAGNDSAISDEGSDAVIYTDMKLLKDACLSFARDRLDIFKLLSCPDIRTIVDKGCPNLFRKAVNSAKRLRAYVHLDEGSVCSECNLRGSCDRAYVLQQEYEASACTVDILRILLFYALDPLVVSGGEKQPGRQLIEVSARKLLTELITLCETSPDAELLKATSQAMPTPEPKISKAVKKTEQRQQTRDFDDNKFSEDVEMKRGDWICSECNFMNFARNIQCLKCGRDGPKQIRSNDTQMKLGDWVCSECNFMNFARNVRCLKCKTEGPARISSDNVEMKKGDWNCPKCQFMNFSSNKKCLRCLEIRPPRHMNPGEWECCSCGYLNFRGNKICRKCDSDRPKLVDTEDENQTWTKPF